MKNANTSSAKPLTKTHRLEDIGVDESVILNSIIENSVWRYGPLISVPVIAHSMPGPEGNTNSEWNI
jgi:hypothetical protein